MTSSAENSAGIKMSVDGEIIPLAEAKRRFGKGILHSPVGCVSTYIAIEVHGGVWWPVTLEFFGGVVGYRFKSYSKSTEYFA